MLILLPIAGFAQPANNECANAIPLAVSGDINCTAAVNGTVLNATASGGTVSCGGTADDDVWYTFTPIYNRVSVTVSNLSSLTATMRYEIYEGSCSGASVFCAMSYNNTFTVDVTPGTAYYIRLYTDTSPSIPALDTDFTICLVTPPPGIAVSTSQYTAQQLVQDVFAAQPGFAITNVTSSTGTNYGSGEPNGIGYFSQTNTTFPFEDGIVLSTGSALAAEGPNGNIQSAGTDAWAGDTDISQAVTASTGGEPFTTKNASSLEFDFVATEPVLSFSFLYASEEYGTFQCDYGDAFAIILTDTQTGAENNLALVPGTTTPISSYTVRNGAFNSACAGANVSYFGTFYQPGIVDGPVNFNGRTTPFFINQEIIAGVTYHLKFVIGDRTDPQFDSAIFLNGGSFNIGEPVPPGSITVANLTPYAVCDDDNDGFALFDLAGYTPQVLGAVSPPGNYTAAYFETQEDAGSGVNAISLSGGYTNNLANGQTVYVRVTLWGTDNYAVAPLALVVHPRPIYQNSLPALATCGDATVNVTTNVATLENIGQYEVTYHLSETTANTGSPALTQPQAYVATAEETVIWVRITDPETGCFAVLQQELVPWQELVVVTVEGSSVIVSFLGAANDFAYTFALNGQPTTQTTFSMDDLNYCDNILAVTNTTCNTEADFYFAIYPQAPTGTSPQAFTQGQTLASLEVEGTGITWFTSAEGGMPLPPDTPLVNGDTYFAAQTIDGCTGQDRLPVIANLTAGLSDGAFTMLKCYPNPVKDELMLANATTLLSARLYNALGQEVYRKDINNTAASLNVSGLSNGIYLLKIEAENGHHTIKLLKN